MSARPSRFWKTFAMPSVVALLTAAGLFSALLGDGWWDTLAWLGMGSAAALSVRGLLRRRS
ncbi:hypothetical protein OX90_24905 [Pseudomonas coronafaciens pv. porri]|uniref:DUF4175 domain-containing protein n=2 Tax=Pseudomonas coronafaciens TaxID=53409 RepID=A0AAE6QLU3_9PSED|nr:hypothetical protein [Pseudomonas coronafaciens]KOP52197.1 hypothetical protein OX90_24905 [Pseudomonas coronafaciens pv. porri]KOP56836.1 hypothetical protein OX88_08295 [Pseudomonas coronafaciens pv. porri]KPZ26761.1 Uncharacterized protein ALO38_00059 [Pseudomonas coronafaciens pv. zizaniae]QGT84048.1 hypothetical protein GMO17_24325 [Pseudomonas coronafaciens pv. coronafaciens]QIQ71892.1 hypothetical protein HBB04_02283 [Pseudomonas coronafaciens]